MRMRKLGLICIAAFVLAACAPDNLDITPTVTPSSTPPPTATRAPTATPNPDATPEAAAQTAGDPQSTVEGLIAQLPGQIQTAFTWRKASGDADINAVDGGITGLIGYSEPGGGQAEITVGVFDTAEAAIAFYEGVLGRVRTLENAETRDNFPQPNAFGGGTYGSDAIFQIDTLYVRVSVPQVSSVAAGGRTENPTVALARQVLNGLGVGE